MTNLWNRVSPTAACLISLWTLSLVADGPSDNDPDKVRQVPRLGIKLSDDDHTRLTSELRSLRKAIDHSWASLGPEARLRLPDVQIYERAVSKAIKFQEFFKPQEIEGAFQLMKAGQRRLRLLEQSPSPWETTRGPELFGYVSNIDNSVQPYGLIIPDSYQPNQGRPFRLDIWLHGRNESITEDAYLLQRQNQLGQCTFKDTFVLHPFGRYSNAFKFAGEIDVFEALADVKKRFPIDDSRVSIRGFSMGGAGCWQLAVHCPDQFFAANPGAGFAETPEFLKFFQKQTLNPTWWEEKLWNWYDCHNWAGNLLNCPTIAYSGEKDRQKQAADIMANALAREGIDLQHVIGPGTGHRIHPESKNEIEDRMYKLADRGRVEFPRTVHFTTFSLRYNRMFWLQVDSLRKHWERSTVEAKVIGDEIHISTRGITGLTLDIPSGQSPFQMNAALTIRIDGQVFSSIRPKSDLSLTKSFCLKGGDWTLANGSSATRLLRKRHKLQGPIDDAFMDRFVFVLPSGTDSKALVRHWVDQEARRAIEQWARHFRGEAIVKLDNEITSEEIASANLILWGTPQSNQLIRRIRGKLPLKWQPNSIQVGSQFYPTEDNILTMVYPNPMNPNRYIVLNSGFTYREFAYLNNARQVPMLPDWAIVNLRVPPSTVWPGKILNAGFFDESWELAPSLAQ